MQRDFGQTPAGMNAFVRKFTTTTVIFFSLAGLVAGFAAGGFIGRVPGSTAANSNPSKTHTPTIAQRTPSASATLPPENVTLGEPAMGQGDYNSPEKADGATSYTLSAQVINKADSTPITVTDVVCRLWLTNDLNATDTALSANNYTVPKTASAFNQPFPSEVPGGLVFSAPSQQVQPCAANSKTTWTYTLATTVPPGTYYLYVLSNWKGKHFNWASRQIAVTA